MSAFRVALLGLCLLFNQAQARQDPVPYQRPPLLTVVIDDLGQNLARDRRVLDLPPGVTLAIIPKPCMPPNWPARRTSAGAR